MPQNVQLLRWARHSILAAVLAFDVLPRSQCSFRYTACKSVTLEQEIQPRQSKRHLLVTFLLSELFGLSASCFSTPSRHHHPVIIAILCRHLLVISSRRHWIFFFFFVTTALSALFFEREFIRQDDGLNIFCVRRRGCHTRRCIQQI